MYRKLLMLSATLLVFGCIAFAADTAFMGVVSDSHCGAKHSTAGDDAAACVTYWTLSPVSLTAASGSCFKAPTVGSLSRGIARTG